MPDFRTLNFPNTPAGQQRKVQTLAQWSAMGWTVVSETITPGKYEGGTACCLATLCLPLAFLTPKDAGIITVTLQNRDGAPHPGQARLSTTPPALPTQLRPAAGKPAFSGMTVSLLIGAFVL